MLRAISQIRSYPLSLRTLANLSLLQPSFDFSINTSFRSLWSSPLLQRRQDEQGNDEYSTLPSRIFVVQPRLRPDSVLKPKLDEALNLANSLEERRDGFYETEFSEKEVPPHIVVQNPAARWPRADTYFGTGTVSTIKCHINALESEGGVDAVFVNAMLTGIQQRNLGREWGRPVIDRVGLIIEIFNAHAQTKEAKLQAELAALMYKKSRLVRLRGPGGRCTFGVMGEAEVVSARGRGSGGRGFISGAGESELQLQRRRILERRLQLLSEIKEVRRTRALQRASRKRHAGSIGQDIATVAVVGYTNAGKSTLVSALTDSYLYSDDRMFATVDPKLSSVILPSGRKVLLSDTVGFISDLPVQLVEAFHATLEEVVEADILVHVLDSSAPDLNEQRETVLQVLEQIGVSKEKLKNMIEVWNKIDLEEEEVGSDEYGNEEEVPEEEYDSVPSDQLSGADCHHDNEIDKDMNPEWEMDDQQGANCESWLALEGEQDLWVNYDDSSVGFGDSEDSWKVLPKGWRTGRGRRDSQVQSGPLPHVKTSALTGVGLQELLELIDERVTQTPQDTPDATIFNRKWRPPRTEDADIAIGQ
ncbi:PREDICTED: GTP-binding protein At3g49725, chloroplastic [Ipomoea nil]|uniref:GTP-binding protein At3g49725, chloroplastic n=1 Tax=Ipomoea nil TaxID=35883 RepID=UPI000901D477|nr:PREDICTED: GTP-binding protein At3g49725, chloroplastic [Ipomoea nil]